jgi:glycerophosphoryl diester phosphodiesterase family protein
MSTGGSAPATPMPSEPLLRLRPLGVGEILDDIFRVYRRHFGLLFAIGLLLSLPSLLIQLTTGSVANVGFFISVFSSFGNSMALAGLPPPAPPNLALLGLSYLLVLVLIPFYVGAVSQAAIDLALGKPVSVRSAFAGVARRYWALLAETLVLAVVILPLLLCFPVAIWLAVRWIVGVPALLAEGIGPIKALGRSWALTRRNWWRMFGILLLIYLLQAVISGALGAIGLPIGLAIPFIQPAVRAAIILTVSAAAGAVTLPVVSLCIVLLYFDLRIRHEHFDLDQLARQAVASSGPA